MRLSILLLACVGWSAAYGQGALLPIVNLREFATLTQTAQALREAAPRASGAVLSAYEAIAYDHPHFAPATLRLPDGEIFEALARYNRDAASVEVLLRSSLRTVSPVDVPVVEIGAYTYLAFAQLVDGRPRWSYGLVQASEPEGPRAAVRVYTLSDNDAAPRGAGIGTAVRVDPYRLDSTTLLLGFRPLPVPPPRKMKALARDLSACEREATAELGRYRPGKEAYWVSFIAAVARCPRGE